MAEESRLACHIQSMGRVKSLVHLANPCRTEVTCPEGGTCFGMLVPISSITVTEGGPSLQLKALCGFSSASLQGPRPAHVEEDSTEMVLKREVTQELRGLLRLSG